ncbi:MAG: hypothetical protein JXA41_01210 [Deltaproteobacteria bacterium]|nr:hypothetical protein [Deltaproteobacteria bacterium]
MGINPTAAQGGNIVPAVYQQRHLQEPLRPTPLTSPVAPDDVVDYVELQSNGSAAPDRPQTNYGTLREPQKTTGTLIDIWI